MSLINKMLQDLEQRHDADSRSQPLAGDVHAVSATGTSAPRAATLAGVLALGIAGLVSAWVVLQPSAVLPNLLLSASSPAVAAMRTQTTLDVPTQPTLAAVAEAPLPVKVRVAVDSAPILAQAVIKRPSRVAPEDAAFDALGVASSPAAAAPANSHKHFTPQQQADNLYKQAVAQLQQGQSVDARQILQQALGRNADHVKARQLLATLLVEVNALDDAVALLRDGLKRSPIETGFSMALARLELERGDTDHALATLAQGVQTAGDEPQYHGFYAVLLQRAKRHDEAVQHYLVALRSDPAMPNWLVGIGISLQAQGKDSDAAEAFMRARDGGLLSAQLLQFVEQQLQQLH
jgi:MSHA biogenesis protein MshN